MREGDSIKKTTIAILGSRGIPNHYGGFEELAEHLSAGLVSLGYDVFVYNVHHHPCSEKKWNGVNRLFCYDPERIIGLAGQFIYDLNCINDSRKRGFDVIIQLGYTSSSIWHKRLPSNAKIITNMDGLEWKRQKYNRITRRFLKNAELLAVRNSDVLIADNLEIKDYLQKTYQVSSVFIPYGADNCILEPTNRGNTTQIVIPVNNSEIELKKNEFFLLIARLQPDNHIEEIIQGVLHSGVQQPLVVVGNHKTRYGKILFKKYASQLVLFTGGIYQSSLLGQLRSQASLYFHGHSAGGTNPSLLQAMASSVPICAHDNPFNRSVLGADAFYFRKPTGIASIINQNHNKQQQPVMCKNNLKKIKQHYCWDKIVRDYEIIIKNIVIKQL